MGTLQGFGTIYYGWRFHHDGSATATLWLTAFWLPIIPLRRHQVLAAAHVDSDVRAVFPVGLAATEQTAFRIGKRMPPSIHEVLITLVATYVGLPLCLVVPFAFGAGLSIAVLKACSAVGRPIQSAETVLNVIGMPFGFLGFGLFFWQIILALRRARGIRVSVFGRPALGRS